MNNAARIDRLLRGVSLTRECEPHLTVTLTVLPNAPHVPGHFGGEAGHHPRTLLQKCRACAMVRVWEQCCGYHHVTPWVREEE